jgi:hypothetical protein
VPSDLRRALRRQPPGFATRKEAAAALGITVGEVDAMIDQAQVGNHARPVFARVGGRVLQIAGRPLGVERSEDDPRATPRRLPSKSAGNRYSKPRA